MSETDRQQDRREFFRAIFRGATIAGIAAGLWKLSGRITPSDMCDNDFRCGDCWLLEDCKLPEAALQKHSERKG